MTQRTRSVGRRGFLLGTAAFGAGALAYPAIIRGLVARQERTWLHGSHSALLTDAGYGPLNPMPDQDGNVRLALPQGFHYVTLGMTGSPMADGNPTPMAHDGMAAFPLPNGAVRLIRNHEDRNAPGQGSVLGGRRRKV